MSKPTLGHPTRTAAVMALLSEGKSEPSIAALIGIPVTTVAALRCSAQRAKRYRTSPQGSSSEQIPRHLLRQLAPHAVRRGVKREALAWRIVEKVLEDHLVDAVLDDREELAS